MLHSFMVAVVYVAIVVAPCIVAMITAHHS